MLVIMVPLLYHVRYQVDYEIGQNRPIQANSDCQGHDGIDINCLVCIRVCILITFKKVHNYGEVNKTDYLYTQGYHKLQK